MAQYGILIDNEYCTGCHSCEIACQNEHGFPGNQWGVKVMELGPWQRQNGKWEYRFIPALTSDCDLCAKRTAEGKKPACVHHCLAQAMVFGTLDELVEKMGEKGSMASIFIP
ncbi:4Fe-4S dicluster domain-containing protein [Adlercreutzia sp. ZJ154]|uniref:4Fe-4S dicluster domain-containing protein n=1 Tax=Adlercreutzia sp. ZJ154 TaxID=2709790 RepID=UPI0013EC4091|nr:4Fe-4S dicluster domain-containing protein [Adlercreutzia sp. ZJ154]